MDHKHCKQHPRPTPFGHGGHPCPAEPKMDDLCESLTPSFAEARPAKTLLINPDMKYGGHLLKKFSRFDARSDKGQRYPCKT